MIPTTQQSKSTQLLDTPISNRRFSYPRGHSSTKDAKLNTSSNFTSAHRSMPVPQQHRGLNDFEGSDTTSTQQRKEIMKKNGKLGIINTSMESEVSTSKSKVNSPTSWICDLSNGAENLFFPRQFTSCVNDDMNISNAAKWREKTTKTILDDSDEEDSTNGTNRALNEAVKRNSRSSLQSNNNHNSLSNSNNMNRIDINNTTNPSVLGRFTPSKRESIKIPTDIDVSNSTTVSSVLTVNSLSTIASSTQQSTNQPPSIAQSHTTQGPNTGMSMTSAASTSAGEARIVAPNVSKLSPNSAVEIRLQSASECVAVLCSVDVLKMRSGYFHDVLSEQEKGRQGGHHHKNSSSSSHSVMIWREPITVYESLPYEAAAYLESLHEGRALFRGDWNFCWARLSVSWIIDDMILEYAAQIEAHMNKILQCIQSNHWRTSPNVLTGMKVAVFRKSSSAVPTIITGIAIEASTQIGYSKLRVAFDHEKVTKSTASMLNIYSTLGATNTTPNILNNIYHRESSFPNAHSNTHSLGGTPTGLNMGDATANSNNTSANSTVALTMQPQPVIGDITEPFWVQSTNEGAVWGDPDDLCMSEAKRLISSNDKKVFWEMARTIMELPQLSVHCKTGICSAEDLAGVLKKPEYKIIWTADAPEYLPKQVATELISAAFINFGNDS